MYDFTKEFKLWKQSINSSRSDQTVIQMKMSYSPYMHGENHSQSPKKIDRTPTLDQTTVARSLQVSGGGVPMFESNEGTLSILSHFVKQM